MKMLLAKPVLTIAALLLFSASAFAATLTVSAQTVPDIRYGGTFFTMRFYVDAGGREGFTSSDQIFHLAGAVGSNNVYKTVTCTLSDTTGSCPSFTIDTTTDALDVTTTKYQVALYDSKGAAKGMWFSNMAVPASLAPATNWTALRTYNRANTIANPPTTYYTSDQVNRLLSVQAQPLASNTLIGMSKLSVAPASSSSPTAVGDNDPRVGVNSSSYASLSAAVTSIGSTPTTLTVTNPFPSGASCTVPSTLTLKFVSGGSLTGSDTVNIQGPIIAPAQPIFATTLTLVFTSNRYIAEYPINWFSVLGNWNGTTGADDTVAFQVAVDSLPQHGTLRVPPNMRIRLTAPLRIWTKREINIIQTSGSYYGDAQTWIDYLGSDSTAAVQIYNSFGVLWDGVKIRLNYGTNVAQIGIDIDQFPDGTVIGGRAISGSVCSQNTIQNTNILTINNNGPNFYGVRIAYTSTVNVEMVKVLNVHVIVNGTNFNVASNANRGYAFYVGGVNSYTTVFDHCGWTFASYGVYGAVGQISVTNSEGQFATVDIVANGGAVHLISYNRSENGRQFFTGVGSVTLISNMIAFGGWDAAYPLIKATGPATLILVGNSFDIDAGITNIDNNTAYANRLVTLGNSFGGPVNYQNFSGGGASLTESATLPLKVTGSDLGYGAVFLLDTRTDISNLSTLNSTAGGLTYARDALPSNSKTGLSGGTGALLLRQNGAWVALNPTYSGTETFAGAATKAVSFSTAFPNANYKVTVTGAVNETFWVTSKTVNGFTVNSSNAASTASVDWILTR